jgi:acyl dehydratase
MAKVHVGQTVSRKRVFSQDDFDRFAELSGDDNPIHVDPEFAAQTRFGQTVCHGMLLYSAICQVLGSELPGPGTIQLEQELMFPVPTFAGEEVTIRLNVLELRPGEQTAVIGTTITRPDGLLSCKGQTVVSADATLLELQSESDSGSKDSEVEQMKGLRLGQTAITERSFTRNNLVDYSDLTGDTNPVFTDAAYARGVGLSGPMIPGGLLGGLFSNLLGTRLPGRGTKWLKQRLHFRGPAYPRETITAQVEIIRLRSEKNLVNLRTTCWNQAGNSICSGEALVLVKDLEKAA